MLNPIASPASAPFSLLGSISEFFQTASSSNPSPSIANGSHFSACRFRPWLNGCRPHFRSSYPIRRETRREPSPRELCNRRHAKLPQRMECRRRAAQAESRPRETRPNQTRRSHPAICRFKPWLTGCR